MREMEDPSQPRIEASSVRKEIEDPSSIFFNPATDRQSERALVIKDDAHIPAVPTTTEDPTMLSERALVNKENAQIPAVPTTTEDPTMLPPAEQAQSTGGCVDSLNVTKTEVQVTESEVPVSPENMAVKGEYREVVDSKDPMLVDGNPEQGALDKPLESPISDIDDSKMKLPRYRSKTLYIVDLHPSAVDKVDELSELFGRVGTLAESIHVIRAETLNQLNPGAGLARCSAYVTFNTIEEACRAWQTLNYHVWENVPMRIMFSNMDPASRYNEKANIIVTNLDESIDSRTLHHHFGEFGVVISSKVELDHMGRSTGRGLVQFQDAEEAQQAIRKMNNAMLRGDRVNVALFVRRTDPTESANLNPVQVNPTPIRPTLAEIVKRNAHLIPEVSSNGSCKINRGSSSGTAQVDVVGNTNYTKLRHFELQRGSSAQRNEARRKYKIEKNSKEMFETAPSIQASVRAASSEPWPPQPWSAEARRKYKIEKNRKEMVFGTAPSTQAFVTAAPNIQAYVPAPSIAPSIQAYVPAPSIQANVPAVPAPSSEPWSPQPSSAKTLKATLAGDSSQKERVAMIEATLFPLVSMHTKEFAAQIVNELVTTLSIPDIEGILKMFEEGTEEALSDRVEEVKLVILDRIKKQPPFQPTSATSADDHAVPIHTGYPIAVPIQMSEFVEPPELPGMAYHGIFVLLRSPQQDHLPRCVPDKYYRQYGTDKYYRQYGTDKYYRQHVTGYYDISSGAFKDHEVYGTSYYDISSGAFKDHEVSSTGSDSEAPVKLKEDDISSEAPAPPTPEPQASSAFNLDEDDLLFDTDDELKSDERVLAQCAEIQACEGNIQ